MKKIVLFIFCICFLTKYTKAQNADINNKIVLYDGTLFIFPSAWLDKKTKARATPINPKKIADDTTQIILALNKYPQSIIKKELRYIYVVGKLSFSNENFTGTNSREDIYIASNKNDEMEKTFHHEFSSILLRNHPDFVMEIKWKEISPELLGSTSAEAMKAGYNSVNFNNKLAEKGYLSPYSLSNWENDFNIYAENIFAGNKEFWKLVDTYPKVKQKTNMVILYYANKIWNGFTEDYFRFSSTNK